MKLKYEPFSSSDQLSFGICETYLNKSLLSHKQQRKMDFSTNTFGQTKCQNCHSLISGTILLYWGLETSNNFITFPYKWVFSLLELIWWENEIGTYNSNGIFAGSMFCTLLQNQRNPELISLRYVGFQIVIVSEWKNDPK